MREGYKDSALGEIPLDWEVVKLGAVLEKIIGGGTPFRDNKLFWNGEIPWATVKDLKGNRLKKTQEYISCLGLSSSSANMVPSGVLIIATRMALGKAVFFDKAVAINQDLKALYTNDFTDSEFIFHWFHANSIEIEKTGSGSTVKGIRLEVLKDFKYLLPPLKEQKKIAEILSTVDEKIEVVEQQINETKELKKGLMQKLITKGINHSKFKDSPLGQIPDSWEIGTFYDYTKVNQGLQISISKRLKKKIVGSEKYITIQFLNKPNDISNIYYVTPPTKGVVCSKDEILMTRTGNTGIVITNVEGVFHNNFFKVAFDRDVFIKDYLFYYLNSFCIQSLIRLYAGGTTIPDLNHGDFYKITLLKPSIKEQIKIAEILTTVDNKLDILEKKKSEIKDLKKGLMQQLLTGKTRVNLN